ncbi:Hypothetical predicted protein [Pelobates cultripes]|uniref:Uncharacterized protein n=1 Tax=Pelobates cultripes TaxID=61616 RepID=A0AAD1SWE5_PELCU|nr:Hypothetical predicted protein [Pelobates cultripes]
MTSCTILQHGGFILVKLNTYDQNKLPEVVTCLKLAAVSEVGVFPGANPS